jgi:hypothetical protein
MSPAIEEQPSRDYVATADDDRTGTTVEILKKAILENLQYVVGKDSETATETDYGGRIHGARPHPRSLARDQEELFGT